MTASERRLLMILCLLAVLAGSMVGAQQLLAWQKRLDRGESRAELLQLEADLLLAEAADWKARATWLQQTQPAMKDALEANEELARAEEQARNRNLEPLSKQLLEPESTAQYRQTGFSMTVRGALPDVLGWLHGMQSPADFRVIPSLKVVPDKDDPALVTATVHFWRWYQPSLSLAGATGAP
jgi:hypothetical protein